MSDRFVTRLTCRDDFDIILHVQLRFVTRLHFLSRSSRRISVKCRNKLPVTRHSAAVAAWSIQDAAPASSQLGASSARHSTLPHQNLLQKAEEPQKALLLPGEGFS